MGELRVFKPRIAYKPTGWASCRQRVSIARLSWALRVIRIWAYYRDSGITPTYPLEPEISDKRSRT